MKRAEEILDESSFGGITDALKSWFMRKDEPKDADRRERVRREFQKLRREAWNVQGIDGTQSLNLLHWHDWEHYIENKGKRGPWGKVLYDIFKGGNNKIRDIQIEERYTEHFDEPSINPDDTYNIFLLKRLVENTSHDIDALIPEPHMFRYGKMCRGIFGIYLREPEPFNLLMWAAYCNNVGAVQLLLEHGADPNKRIYRQTAVQCAVANVFEPERQTDETMSQAERESIQEDALQILDQLLDKTNENADLLNYEWKKKVKECQDQRPANDTSFEGRGVDLLMKRNNSIQYTIQQHIQHSNIVSIA